MVAATARTTGRRRGATRRLGLILVAAAVVPTTVSTAQTRERIRWRGGGELGPVAPAEAAVEARHVVVHLARVPSGADRAALERAGVRLLSPLAPTAYFARVQPGAVGGERTPLVVEASNVAPRAKLHPAVRDGSWPDWAIAAAAAADATDDEPAPPRIVTAIVAFHRGVPEPAARQVASLAGATVRSALAGADALVVDLPRDAVATLAERDEVMWIEPPLPALGTTNAENRGATQADLVQAAPYGLDGHGVRVLVYDGGVAMQTHLDFGDRLTVGEKCILSNHATHVCGTIAGNGAASGGAQRGMAPQAELLSFGFHVQGESIFLYTNPGDLENDYMLALGVHDADIANNSLGVNIALNGYSCDLMGEYGITSGIIDAIVRGSLGPRLHVVWAAGNERDPGVCGDGYFTTAPPATAKNHITVGALDANDNAVTMFTSWGPTADGRLKPDLCAPGCESGGDSGVTSTSSTGSYTPLCGTSMSAPTVTGLAALLLQDRRAAHPERPEPTPAMLKALLLHTALDLGAAGPDYQTGFGLVQIRDAIDFARTDCALEAQVAHGEELTYRVQVDEGSGPLRATLVWDDPPATPNVEPALVNDLDLVVIGPDGATFSPWTLDPQQPGAPAVRTGPDRLNNVEQVVIDCPGPGAYSVRVVGHAVAEGPQGFALTAGPGLVGTTLGFAPPPPATVGAGEPLPIEVVAQSAGEAIVDGSVTLHHRADEGAWWSEPMTVLGDGRYAAEVPAPDRCGGVLQVYVTAAGTMSGPIALPAPGAAAPLAVPVLETVVSFEDDFEIDRGWSVVSTPGLVNGAWERGWPAGSGGRGDPIVDADGSGRCYLTDNGPGNTDVDGGATTLRSPAMSSGLEAPFIRYARWLSNVQGAHPFEDAMVVEVSDDDGATWRLLEMVGPGGPDAVGGWIHRAFDLRELDGFALNDVFRIRFTVADALPAAVVEAAIDAVRLSSDQCGGPAACPADVDGSGAVDVDDLLLLLQSWGPCASKPTCHDVTGDAVVDVDDLLAVITGWGCAP